MNITEIIPDDLPGWAIEAMSKGQLFNEMLSHIERGKYIKLVSGRHVIGCQEMMKQVAIHISESGKDAGLNGKDNDNDFGDNIVCSLRITSRGCMDTLKEQVLIAEKMFKKVRPEEYKDQSDV